MTQITKNIIKEDSHIELNDKKSLKFVFLDLSMPEEVVYQYEKTYVGYLYLKDVEDSIEILEILIKNIIIEYKPDIRVKKYDIRGKTYNYTYLKTYVSIGIPSHIINLILKKVSNHLGYDVECWSRNMFCEYVWVSTGLPTYKDVDCIAYSSHSKSKIMFGSLTNVILRLQSNVLGHRTFRIKILKDKSGIHILRFTLNDFQIIKTINIGSCPIIEEDVSNDLLELFNGKAFI